ncbi:hypothetical protein HRG_002107 [Hirsutella rhossiliensis]|uniref:Uncharacterized protein n=1 Tax=Hirsutella rhossiliensis TaxID=111463 RepID=A0A9P8N1W2_9HYPO|nr:uncharacterized protein HRG_02107 [Hirsutella rhossiliensis]KAH0966698.1 hypothetical protein HRG_02107 [Hirsutella rhossiliensis]
MASEDSLDFSPPYRPLPNSTAAFWLRYQPAEQESFDDVVALLHRVMPKGKGLYVAQRQLDGQRVVEVLFCSQARYRVTSMCSRDKWARKGAQGQVVGITWPSLRQTREVFIADCLDQLRRIPKEHSLGSLKEFLFGLDASLDRESERMARLRKSPTTRVYRHSPGVYKYPFTVYKGQPRRSPPEDSFTTMKAIPP